MSEYRRRHVCVHGAKSVDSMFKFDSGFDVRERGQCSSSFVLLCFEVNQNQRSNIQYESPQWRNSPVVA